MKFKNNPQLLFSSHGETVQQTCLLQELSRTQANPGPVQSMADTAVCVGHREQATLTFGDDIQDHVERDKSSDHEQEGRCVRQGELDSPVAVVEEPDDQGHQAGLHPMDEEGWQVSEIVGNLTT